MKYVYIEKHEGWVTGVGFVKQTPVVFEFMIGLSDFEENDPPHIGWVNSYTLKKDGIWKFKKADEN